MTTQCKSCGGFCGEKCERSNMRGPVGFGQPRKATVIALDDLNAIQKQLDGLRKAAQQALEWFEWLNSTTSSISPPHLAKDVQTALREELSE